MSDCHTVMCVNLIFCLPPFPFHSIITLSTTPTSRYTSSTVLVHGTISLLFILAHPLIISGEEAVESPLGWVVTGHLIHSVCSHPGCDFIIGYICKTYIICIIFLIMFFYTFMVNELSGSVCGMGSGGSLSCVDYKYLGMFWVSEPYMMSCLMQGCPIILQQAGMGAGFHSNQSEAHLIPHVYSVCLVGKEICTHSSPFQINSDTPDLASLF